MAILLPIGVNNAFREQKLPFLLPKLLALPFPRAIDDKKATAANLYRFMLES